MRTLAPWDANRWFALPHYSEVTVPVGSPSKVLDADPMRVGLLFGVGIGAPGNVSVAPSQGLTTQGGYSVANGQPPLQILHSELGPMVAAEWWAYTNVAFPALLSVTEITLRDWPEGDPHDNMDVQDYLEYIASFIRELSNRAVNQQAIWRSSGGVS